MRPLTAIALFLLGAALFSAAYCQAPLYYSNQNQYFLHGLADAGVGLLNEDWLATTADPTPLFSALVSATARFLHPWAFHIYLALLVGVYGAALLGIFAWLVGPEMAARRWPVFLALLIAVHSGLARWLSYRYFGQDYPWYFQAGVAGQYVLGAMLQPSVFGVLLVLAIALFVRGQPFLAVVAAALGATVHSTYVLPAGLLTAGFMTALAIEGQARRALAVGALALVLVVPVTAYVLAEFSPTTTAEFAEAQGILVNLRIPHHCLPGLWFDTVAGLQIAWVVLAMALVWRTRLFPVLAVSFVLALLLTLAQLATGSNALALLFPWRLSAVLVPVATTIVLSRLVALRFLPVGNALVWATSALAVACLAAAGSWINTNRLAFRSGDEELAMMDFVRETRKPGDLYLLPVRVPNLTATTHGSLSSDFKPLAEKQQDARIIPVNLQRFRLYTGAPIFVDFKSIPYRDTDVIKWRFRLEIAEFAQKLGDNNVWKLRYAGVTHTVVPTGTKRTAPDSEIKIYGDAYYEVYRVLPTNPKSRTSIRDR
jgi:hypothetical protein